MSAWVNYKIEKKKLLAQYATLTLLHDEQHSCWLTKITEVKVKRLASPRVFLLLQGICIKQFTVFCCCFYLIFGYFLQPNQMC